MLIISAFAVAARKIRQLTEIDRRLCQLLEQNARLSLTELAERVGLSVTATSDHIRKLEQNGIITGYHAHLSPSAIGLDITAFVFVWVEGVLTFLHSLLAARKSLLF